MILNAWSMMLQVFLCHSVSRLLSIVVEDRMHTFFLELVKIDVTTI